MFSTHRYVLVYKIFLALISHSHAKAFLESELRMQEVRRLDLEGDYASKVNECETLFSNVSRLQDDVKSKEEQLEALEAESRESEDRVNQMSKDIIDLNRKRQEDVESISALGSSLQAKETEIKVLMAAMEGLRSSFSLKQEEFQRLQSEGAKSQLENENLKKSLEEALSRNQETSSIEGGISILSDDKIQLLETSLEQERSEKERIKEKMKSIVPKYKDVQLKAVALEEQLAAGSSLSHQSLSM
jgi:chromosome segregation ATPase